MNAIIYSDIFLRRLLDDVEKWYNKHIYHDNHVGPKPKLEKHLIALHEHYNYALIEGDNVREKRINYLSKIQDMADQDLI